MARKTTGESGKGRRTPIAEPEPDVPGDAANGAGGKQGEDDGDEHHHNGGWREIEALREKAALKASLADVWDEDFDLDEEILAELDHTAEFFTTEEEAEEEAFDEDENIDEDIGELFDEEED